MDETTDNGKQLCMEIYNLSESFYVNKCKTNVAVFMIISFIAAINFVLNCII